MDNHDFDALARNVAASSSRRSVLKGVAGGALASVLGVVGIVSTDAQEELDALRGGTCLAQGQRCRRDGDCCSRFCPRSSGADRCNCRPDGFRCRDQSECCSGVCAATRNFGDRCGGVNP